MRIIAGSIVKLQNGAFGVVTRKYKRRPENLFYVKWNKWNGIYTRTGYFNESDLIATGEKDKAFLRSRRVVNDCKKLWKTL